ncbi:MAG TPA: type VI secretion system contractile sheath large subunit [Polyangiales bacterium]|nr:type VI secretion system contractile sheath large subunit [Polyangiales bacterium]
MTRLTFDFGVGNQRSAAPRGERASALSETGATRVLVIADLRGDSREPAATLERARLTAIDVDNFERVFAELGPQLSLNFSSPALRGGSGGERRLRFESLEDFHPDRLYDALDLAELRRRPAQPRTAATAEDDASTLGRLLGAKPSAPAAPRVSSGIDQLVHELVSPHIVRGPDPEQSQLMASGDAAIGDELRRVLHAPAFQRLEASWRALRWLVCESALGADLSVSVLDATREELLADLRACRGELERSQLYRLIVREQVGGPDPRPFSLIIGDLSIAGSEEDVSLLAGLGALAAQAGGCFLAAAEPPLWGANDLAREPDRSRWSAPDSEVAARMALLRASAVAPFIGLCMPRVLGRVPYGQRSEPIERFDFDELPEDPAHDQFLWLNPAFACAQLILAGVAERGWERGPGSQLDLADLPQAAYRASGRDAYKPCAEVFLDESSAEQALGYGLMPLLSYRNRNAVRLLRLQSIASPAAALALGGEHA